MNIIRLTILSAQKCNFKVGHFPGNGCGCLNHKHLTSFTVKSTYMQSYPFHHITLQMIKVNLNGHLFNRVMDR